jgi:acetate kinase
MGLTPLSGLPMATRAGDLDFGAALFVAENSNMTVSELRELLNEKAGLQGLSGMSGDMLELLECASESPLASHAIDYFCYHAAKQIAGLTVPLGGLDAIVFTGGIGAASQEIRERICRRLSHFGVDAPESRAENVEPRRPEEGKAQRIFVVSSDENAVIARHVNSTISASPCAGSD